MSLETVLIIWAAVSLYLIVVRPLAGVFNRPKVDPEYQKKIEQYAAEFARLTKEIEDAKIRYDNSKRDALKSDSDGGDSLR